MNLNLFDASFFKRFCETSRKDGNVLFSPLNISLALSRFLLGFEGKTRKQLREALGFSKYDDFLENLKPLLYSHHANSIKLKTKLPTSSDLKKLFG